MSERQPRRELRQQQSFIDEVKRTFNIEEIDDFEVLEYFARKDPVPFGGMSILVPQERTIDRRFFVAGSFTRNRELIISFAELCKQIGQTHITRETLEEMEKNKSFEGKSVLSVGGVWGEIFAPLGAHCISIDPLMNYMQGNQEGAWTTKLKPIPIGNNVTRLDIALTPETVDVIKESITPDIVLSSGQLEYESGLVGVLGDTTQEQIIVIEQNFAKNLLEVCAPGGVVVIKGQDVHTDRAVLNNPAVFNAGTQLLMNLIEQRMSTTYLALRKSA